MITLHHLNMSRSLRVVWLLEELGLPYDLVCHRRQPDMLAGPDLRMVHPLGKAPVIDDDGVTLFESGAILEFIIHRHGQGRLSVPCHHTDYAAYLTWLHAAEGTAVPRLMPLIWAVLRGPAATQEQHDANDRVLRLCDDTLARHAYFGGSEFSAADIMMHTYLALCARFAATAVTHYDRLTPFLEHVQSRAAYQRAIEVTEPL